MDKTDRHDLIYLIKQYVLWLLISTILFAFVGGTTFTEAFIISFLFLSSGALFLWVFIHPLVKRG